MYITNFRIKKKFKTKGLGNHFRMTEKVSIINSSKICLLSMHGLCAAKLTNYSRKIII